MDVEDGDKLERVEALLEDASTRENVGIELLEFLLNSKEKGNETARFKDLRKRFLLESYHINKLHREYKLWEDDWTKQFVEEEVRSYNRKLGEMARINYNVERLSEEYSNLKRKISLPKFTFSFKTIEAFENGRLVQFVSKNEKGEYPSSVELGSLFSLDRQSHLLPPDFDIFKKLMNIEYRLRIERKAKYDILLSIKQDLTSKNIKWATRDTELNNFINTKLSNVIKDVEKVRKSEHEELKYYGDLSDSDFSSTESQDMEVLDEESEMNMKENLSDQIDSEAEAPPQEADSHITYPPYEQPLDHEENMEENKVETNEEENPELEAQASEISQADLKAKELEDVYKEKEDSQTQENFIEENTDDHYINIQTNSAEGHMEVDP